MFRRKKREGFSLIELLIVIFLVSLLMTAVTGIFLYMFNSYRTIRTMQKDVESAQFALNTMTKTLRTSTIMVPNGSSALEDTSNPYDTSIVRAYDYSTGKCFVYSFDAGTKTLRSGSGSPSNTDTPEKARQSCNFSTISLSPLVTGKVEGNFHVVPSLYDADVANRRVGRVTVGMKVATDAGHPVDIQSTVSLHDYGYVQLGQ